MAGDTVEEVHLCKGLAVEFVRDLVLAYCPASGRLLDVNRAALSRLGYSQREMVGLAISDVFDQAGDPLFGRHGRQGAFLTHKSGTAVRVEALIRDGDCHCGAALLIATDMTDDELLGERLGLADLDLQVARRDAQMLRSGRLVSMGTLAAGVAHEINNPLAYVQGNIHYLLRQLDTLIEDPDQLRQILLEAADGTERIRVITRDLQTFSRDDDEVHVPVDIHSVLDTAVNLAQNEITHRAKLFRDFGDVRFVLGSESRLSQVFVNLLINAAQSIPEGRSGRNEIRIRTGMEFGKVFVEIKDTGCGIRLDTLNRIFDPFFTTKDIGNGTGLGLSICQGLVARMGGEIHVESEIDVGTLFRVTLPVAVGQKTNQAARTQTLALCEPAEILLIDDDEPVARSLARLLDRHSVTVVTSGRGALEILDASQAFDLVLCDLMLPDVNGVEIYQRLRVTDPLAASRFVFMTGGVFTASTRQFVAETDNPVVQKPFDVRRIEGLLRSLSGR